MKKTIIYLAAFVCIQLATSFLVAAAWRIITGSPDMTAWQIITTSLVADVIVLALFLSMKWAVLKSYYLRTRPWMAIVFSALAAAGTVLPAEWILEKMPELPNIVEGEFGMVLDNPAGYMVIGIFAPLVEEVVFRGAILRALLRSMKSHWGAIAISAVLFSLVHANPAQMPYALAIGMLLGWMYWRTDSVVPGIAFHWMNNTIAYVAYNVMPNPDAKLIDYFAGNERTMLLALGFSLCILIPSLVQLNIWLRKADDATTADGLGKNGRR